MRSKVLRLTVMLASVLLLCSWGEKGHQKINGSAARFFPHRLNRYNGWTEVLTLHGSEADNRRKTDPTEGIKHYIDIDAYSDFIDNHKIIEDETAAFNKYSRDFVMKNGTLPWVTDSTYHVLVKHFRAKDWEKALLTAADLGHYIGDGHMPLHLTVNYDGKLSGQTGIHGRYESKMINTYIDSLTVKRSRSHRVKDVRRYVFDYMYYNYRYKDSLLNADKRAFERAGHEYNDLYYQVLWEGTKDFTNEMITGSSRSLTELIRTAWIEAGRPRIPRHIDVSEINHR
jgi:hypothetical protein